MESIENSGNVTEQGCSSIYGACRLHTTRTADIACGAIETKSDTVCCCEVSMVIRAEQILPVLHYLQRQMQTSITLS